MTPPFTILLVTMNRRDLLEIALWYIYQTSTDEERNIWIWDNASQDDTPDFLGTMVGWPGVRVFRSKTNIGLVGPRKRMLPHVETPYIFTLDDDTWIVNRGWATGVSRVLAADPSIHQLAVPQGYVHSTSNYGVTHGRLDRPFFRIPPVWPEGKLPIEDPSFDPLRNHVDMYGTPRPGEMAVTDIAEEKVAVPTSGTQLPFAVSGNCSAWRTSDVLPLIKNEERHPVMDLREAWGFPLQKERGMREGTILGYGMFHPCPGPLWHLGRGERHWDTRCDMAQAVYNRSSEEQRSWLEEARKASGWGRSLENPDDALPVIV